MDSLRLILLVIGILLIAGIYLAYRFKQDAQNLKLPRPGKIFQKLFSRIFAKDSGSSEYNNNYDELDPSDIEQFSATSTNLNEPLDDDALDAVSAYSDIQLKAGVVDDLVIVLNIMAKKGRSFKGLDILDALLGNGFAHGEMSVFHYFENESDKIPVCSIANVVEPGTFDLTRIELVNTPGMSLFMQLPGDVESRQSFEIMLNKGRAIAEELQGELCDETRSVLTMQTIGHLKEKIEAWLFKQKMAQLQASR